MKTSRFNRILSALLAFVLFLGCIPAFPVLAQEEQGFRITLEGETVTELEIPRNQKRTVTAEGIPAGHSYQWEIKIPGTDMWVKIQGQTSRELGLSVALLGSLLEEDSSAMVRCAAMSGGNAASYTEPLRAWVTEPVVKITEEPVSVPETIAPSEETTAPEEPDVSVPETTEPEQTIPVETTVPTESVVLETEPDAPSEETVAPTVPEEIAPETVPEMTVPAETEAVEETTAPTVAETIPETTAPAETEAVEETTAPTVAETVPETTAPAETEPTRKMLFTAPGIKAVKAVADEGTEIVAIKIEYYYEDRLGNRGNMVMDPYVARISKGDALKVTVACKVFPGYQIRLVGNTEGITLDSTKNELSVDVKNVTNDITFEVHYKEVMVKYYARFFLQNAYNDLYTERTDVLTADQIASMVGYAGEEPNVSLIHPEIEGFSALFHQPDKIAADGSTVFEVYYDRNYYLINFDLNGGFGTAPVYARYDTSFTVATPTRPGYGFNGWEKISGTVPADAETDANGLVKKIPASNVTYRAKWTQEQTKYSVVYWKENAEDNKYTFWKSTEKTAKTGSKVSGVDDINDEEKEYFTFNPVLSDKDVVIEGDGSTVINVYYTRNYYTINFMAHGNCTIPVTHTHTDACYRYLCFGEEHTHTDCLDCELEEHTHNAACCTLQPHAHTSGCCIKEPHTHEKACWGALAGNSANPTNAPTRNLKQGQIYRYRRNNSYEYTYYIYIGTSWYIYGGTGSQSIVGNTINPTCGKEVHAHNDGNCAYDHDEHDHSSGCNGGNCTEGGIEHTHDKTCYTCGKIAHTHSDSCRDLICTLQNTHTHTNACRGTYVNGAYTYRVKTVTRKYQASLDDIWQHTDTNGKSQFGLQDDNGAIYDSGERWSPSGSTYYSQVLVYIANMPGDDFTLTLDISTNQERTMYYYLQVLPGEAYDETWSGKNYKLVNTIKAKYGRITEAEDFFAIRGYVKAGSDPAFSGGSISANTAKFYYDRITNDLQFRNNGVPLTDKKVEGVMYGASLKGYEFTPEYPSNLEPNAYYFDQWYTTEGFYPGTEVNWETLTMPEGNLLLYAKWLPLRHDVYFYMDYDRYLSGTTFQNVQGTAHGEKMVTSGIDLTPKHNIHSDYEFVGWFYFNDDGEKTAFNPAEMAVRQELHLYAEWTSMVVTEYKVSYKLGKEDGGKIVPIEEGQVGYRVLAEDTTGYAFEASTRTFSAKPENQLNLTSEEMGDSIWVPHTNSHSILMEEDKNENVFTFWYVPKENIPYTVRYLDKATGQPVVVDGSPKADKTVDPNKDAVVTEQFVYVPGYVPDAFHKTLILSADDSENVITFYYTKNDTETDENGDGKPDEKARYLVVHYIQKSGGEGYTEYTTEDLIGVVGSTVQAEALTIPGFAFNRATPRQDVKDGKNYATGEVTSGEEGTAALKLELYYDRIKYKYTVEYLDTDTKQSVTPTKITEANYEFDTTVTETALDIEGYTLYGEKTQTLKISAIEALNKITFLYNPIPLQVHYKAVCSMSGLTDYGFVQKSDEYKDIQGTSAVALPGFRFVGWYSDEACTENVSNEAFYNPNVSTAGGVYEYTYYALFEPIKTSLKIVKTVQGAPTGNKDSFLFRVQGTAGTATRDVDMMVVIHGDSSAIIRDVNCGEYTVTELTDWSWKYDCGESVVKQTIKEMSGSDIPETNIFNFTNTHKNPDWLGGENYRENIFS